MAVSRKTFCQMEDEALKDEWLADRIYAVHKGNLTPTREHIIETLNQRRRKEGIYARAEHNPVRKTRR